LAVQVHRVEAREGTERLSWWEREVQEGIRSLRDTRAPPSAGGVEIRFPSLEIAALRSARLLTTREAPLSEEQRGEAAKVFGDSLGLDAVRIAWSRLLLKPGTYATIGNLILVPYGEALPTRKLIHELAHVWQYQSRGTSYISDSACRQAGAWLRGDFRRAYRYRLVRGKDLLDYPAEEQAQIIEDLWAGDLLGTLAEAEVLKARVQEVRPMPAQVPQADLAASLPPAGMDVPRSPAPGWPFREPSVPLFELRFP